MPVSGLAPRGERRRLEAGKIVENEVNMKEQEVELKDLVGMHRLSGVTFERLEPEADADCPDEAANSCTFILDGKAYQAIENPADGYRSSMRSLRRVSVKAVKNRFEPIRVLCRYQGEGDFGEADDLLEMLECVTGRTLLTVGTRRVSDYYPVFVADWQPEKIPANAT
jgi:hypothetical protein